MTTDSDARSVQRRLDTLAAAALSVDDPSLLVIAEAREAVQRLVLELTYRKRGHQRRAKGAGRRTHSSLAAQIVSATSPLAERLSLDLRPGLAEMTAHLRKDHRHRSHPKWASCRNGHAVFAVPSGVKAHMTS